MTRPRGAPVDPRLWRRSAPARRYLFLTVLCELVMTGCTLVIAIVLARALSQLITNPAARDLPHMWQPIILLAVLWALQALAHGVQVRFSERGATGSSPTSTTNSCRQSHRCNRAIWNSIETRLPRY